MTSNEQDINPSLRMLHRETEVYQHNDDIYAEFHIEKYLEYEFFAENCSSISLEYDDEWFITAKESPCFEFIGRSNLTRLYDENLLEWERRDQQRRRCHPCTSESQESRRQPNVSRDPEPPRRVDSHP